MWAWEARGEDVAVSNMLYSEGCRDGEKRILEMWRRKQQQDLEMAWIYKDGEKEEAKISLD